MKNKTVENENIICVDIDDTMILYPEESLNTNDQAMLGYKEFTDFTGKKFRAMPSEKHIRLIQYYNARGFYVLVWSGNGYRHARNILEQLNLLQYVDQIMTKPSRYLDDVECQHWMGKRIYLEKGQKV